ncbi:hypothetical protein [Alcanivorax sp.]|uniref:hypothetical protein n=1 Tax=Alcanivorax sp. TaxID=1872427 RepID=UPI002437708E|nr:hypothetical protein [Alcanivorax sp.]
MKDHGPGGMALLLTILWSLLVTGIGLLWLWHWVVKDIWIYFARSAAAVFGFVAILAGPGWLIRTLQRYRDYRKQRKQDDS